MRSVDDIRDETTRAVQELDLAALRRLHAELLAHPDRIAQADAMRLEGVLHDQDGNVASAISCFTKAREIYVELQNALRIAHTDNDLGTAYSRGADSETSLKCYRLAIDQFLALGCEEFAVSPMFNIALYHSRRGQFDEALEMFDRCLEIAVACNDQIMTGMIYNNVAMIHQRLGDASRALEGLHRALDIAQTINSNKVAFFALRGLGITYIDVGNFPSALEHLHRAYDLALIGGQRSRLSQISINIGNLHFQLNELDASLEWQQKALVIEEERGDLHGTAAVLMNIANVHNVRGDVDASIVLYTRALEIFRSLNDTASTASILANMAASLFNVGRLEEGRPLLDEAEHLADNEPTTVFLHKQLRAGLFKTDGDLASAINTLHEALDIAERHQLRMHAASAHEDLREIALLQNDLASYVRHNTACTEIRAEVAGVATAQRLAAQHTERSIALERQEREKERAVLYSTLPKHIADRIVRGEQVTGDHYDNAAVFFVDIVGFTNLSDQLSASEVVSLLERLYSQFDEICKRHDVTKIKTIGDSYMAVAFPNTVPRDARDDISSEQRVASLEERAARAALDMLGVIANAPSSLLKDLLTDLLADLPNGLQVRIGLHNGPVTAGVIGTERLQYDVWGDTVNVASRLESTGEPGKIHVSEAFASALRLPVQRRQELRHDDVAPGTWHLAPGTWHVAPRGEIELKGKGTMTTYWLEGNS